jgi:hypothetical protein
MIDIRAVEEELAQRLELWHFAGMAGTPPTAPCFTTSWAEAGRVIDAMLKRGHEFELSRFMECTGCGWIAHFLPLAPWKPQWPRTVLSDPEAAGPLVIALAALVALMAMDALAIPPAT